MEETPQQTIDRMLNEAAALRDKVSKNADLYRRDVQYAIDLMEDAKKGEIRLDDFFGPVLTNLKVRHQEGRAELKDWRATENQGA